MCLFCFRWILQTTRNSKHKNKEKFIFKVEFSAKVKQVQKKYQVSFIGNYYLYKKKYFHIKFVVAMGSKKLL